VSGRVLLVANETVAGEAVHAPVDLRDAEVLVVAPALNGRVACWSSDEDRSHWLAHEIAARARARFPHPVHEIVAA
jgi:hypothetical protein